MDVFNLFAEQEWDAENYELPGIDLLEEHDSEGRVAADPAELEEIQETLIETLGQFGIQVAPGDITKGPTITRYEVYPAKGVRVDKIVSLERDLARATRAERINILAPIPGKDTVGIELANTRKVTVTVRELLESPDWEEAKARAKIRSGVASERSNTLTMDPPRMTATRSLIPRISGRSEEIIRIATPCSASFAISA